MVGVCDDLTTPPLPFCVKAIKEALIVMVMSADESGRVYGS